MSVADRPTATTSRPEDPAELLDLSSDTRVELDDVSTDELGPRRPPTRTDDATRSTGGGSGRLRPGSLRARRRPGRRPTGAERQRRRRTAPEPGRADRGRPRRSDGLGEFELIARDPRAARASPAAPRRSRGLVIGSGDDAAVTRSARGHRDHRRHAGRGRPLPARDRSRPRDRPQGARRRRSRTWRRWAPAPARPTSSSGSPSDFGDERVPRAGRRHRRGRRASTASRSLGGDIVRAPALVLAVTVGRDAPARRARSSRRAAPAGRRARGHRRARRRRGRPAAARAPRAGRGLDRRRSPTALRRASSRPQPRIAAGRGAGRRGGERDDRRQRRARRRRRASRGARAGSAIELEVEPLPVAAGVAEVAAAAGVDPLELAARRRRGLRAAGWRCRRSALAAGADGGAREPALGLTEIGEVEPGPGVELSGRGAERSGRCRASTSFARERQTRPRLTRRELPEDRVGDRCRRRRRTRRARSSCFNSVKPFSALSRSVLRRSSPLPSVASWLVAVS